MDNTREIILFGGEIALVDSIDYDRLIKSSWHLEPRRMCVGYAVRSYRVKGVTVTERMHRVVLNNPPYRIDHKDRNGLNNKRNNLREATRSQNAANKIKQLDKGGIKCRSPYKGVRLESNSNDIWLASIVKDQKRIKLGRFDDEAEAALAYDIAALEIYGDFACTNFPIDEILHKSPRYRNRITKKDLIRQFIIDIEPSSILPPITQIANKFQVNRSVVSSCIEEFRKQNILIHLWHGIWKKSDTKDAKIVNDSISDIIFSESNNV